MTGILKSISPRQILSQPIYLIYISVFFSIISLSVFLSSCGFSDDISQPIAYNHYLHFDEVGLDCTDCHTGVETKIKATLPSLEICENCHTDMNGESPEEEKVVEAVNNGVEIPWKRIYVLEDHVFFSHRRHVSIGNISCTVCHGDVGKLTAPPKQQPVPIRMEACMKCHDDKSISNDCLTCHV